VATFGAKFVMQERNRKTCGVAADHLPDSYQLKRNFPIKQFGPVDTDLNRFPYLQIVRTEREHSGAAEIHGPTNSRAGMFLVERTVSFRQMDWKTSSLPLIDRQGHCRHHLLSPSMGI
jgi:hypothetical protein